MTESSASVGPVEGEGPCEPIPLVDAKAVYAQPKFSVEGAIDGEPRTGWAVDGKGPIDRDHAAWFRVAKPIPTSGRARLAIRIEQGYVGSHTLGRFRIKAGRSRDPRPIDATTPVDQRRREHLAARFAEWESGLEAHLGTPVAPSSVASAKGATMTVLADASVLATGDKLNNDTCRVELPVGRAVISAGSPARPVVLIEANEDFASANRSAALAVDGKADTGWSIQGGVGRPHAAVFAFKEPLSSAPGTLVVTLHQRYIHQMTLGRFRLSTTADPGPIRASGLPAEAEAIAATPKANRTAEQTDALLRQFLLITAELKAEHAAIAKLRASMPRFATSMVMLESAPEHARTTHVRRRGEFLRPAEAVSPGSPAVLHPMPSEADRDRLALARWLVSEDSPLVGRVVMNRAWHAFFGWGLVGPVDDFGVRGERPTHPELLDWPATEFPRRGWSQKAMHRLIVTSRTYRQDSRATPEAIALDPRNELLVRGPRFRVEAEVIRDIALAASELLNLAISGPSVYPPQPDGVTSVAYSQPSWPTSTGRDRYRRGLYTNIKRTAPFAALTTLDAPTSEVTCVRRERSNTPLQSLTLLNDVAFVEAERALARRVLAEGPHDAEGRARLAFRLCPRRRAGPPGGVPGAAGRSVSLRRVEPG